MAHTFEPHGRVDRPVLAACIERGVCTERGIFGTGHQSEHGRSVGAQQIGMELLLVIVWQVAVPVLDLRSRLDRLGNLLDTPAVAVQVRERCARRALVDSIGTTSRREPSGHFTRPRHADSGAAGRAPIRHDASTSLDVIAIQREIHASHECHPPADSGRRFQ